MTNRTRELLDFAQMEPDSLLDIEEMLLVLWDVEFEYLERLIETLDEAVKAARIRREN